MDTREKIVRAEQAAQGVAGPLAVARGRFDVLTADHCRILADTKRNAERLIALVLRDREDEPSLLDEAARAQLTAALGVVDRVVICDEAESEALIAEWRPSTAIDVEAYVRRNVVADVLERHPGKG